MLTDKHQAARTKSACASKAMHDTVIGLLPTYSTTPLFYWRHKNDRHETLGYF
jgi:hypothetical protein